MTDFSMPPGNMSGGGSTGKTDRDKIIDAFMSLLAERPFERIGLAAIAQSAGVSLAHSTMAQCSTGDNVAADSPSTSR